ncbi:MAG: hypothetical protein SF187_11090 [Deltaproteobacteria bacterium]|nr:hypothetical protein [Deltaproteobacteria bacterium]
MTTDLTPASAQTVQVGTLDIVNVSKSCGIEGKPLPVLESIKLQAKPGRKREDFIYDRSPRASLGGVGGGGAASFM